MQFRQVQHSIQTATMIDIEYTDYSINHKIHTSTDHLDMRFNIPHDDKVNLHPVNTLLKVVQSGSIVAINILSRYSDATEVVQLERSVGALVRE